MIACRMFGILATSSVLAASALAAGSALAQTYPAPARAHQSDDEMGRRFGWALDLSAGPAIPTDHFGSEELHSGFSLSVDGSYSFNRSFGLYSGLTASGLGADRTLTGSDAIVLSYGYSLGLQFGGGFGSSRLGWRLRAGAIYDKIRIVENDDYWERARNVGRAGYDWGWELGLVLTVHVGGGWHLTPGLTYRALTDDVEVDGTVSARQFNVVRVGMGFSKTF